MPIEPTICRQCGEPFDSDDGSIICWTCVDQALRDDLAEQEKESDIDDFFDPESGEGLA